MALGALGADPRIPELHAVLLVLLDGGAEGLGGVDGLAEPFLAEDLGLDLAGAGGGGGGDVLGHEVEEAGIAGDGGDVLELRDDEGVGAGKPALTRDAGDGRLLVEHLVGVEPVLLGARLKELGADVAGHGAGGGGDGLGVGGVSHGCFLPCAVQT